MSATAITGQAPIILGPLPTIFTPPPACGTAVASINSEPSGLLDIVGNLIGGPGSKADIARLGQTCSRGEAIDATSCWPPVSSGALTKSSPLEGWGFYSPGVQCPAGYATACSAIGGSKEAGWEMQFKLQDGETAVGCCPSGYKCANIGGQTCLTVATSIPVSLAICDGSKVEDLSSPTVPSVESKATAFSIFAPMIQINWQGSGKINETASASPSQTEGPDASPTTTPMAPEETKSTPISMSGTQSINTEVAPSGSETLALAPVPSPTASSDGNGTASSSTNSESSTPEANGMTSSTKIGLGVAGGAVAAVAAIVAVFYIWRRRKNQHEEAELDRLYGMKHVTGSSSDLTAHHDEIPGWYRGQRPFSPMTPTVRVEPYQGGLGGGGGSGALGLTAPSSPYYRPYRPS